MSTRTKAIATAEARSSVARSAGPISRHDVALQRYLVGMQHTALHDSTLPDHREYPPAGRVPLLSEIHSIPPTVSPAREPATGSPAGSTRRKNLVVVGLDGSTHSRRAAEWAAAEAASRQAPLHLVYAYSLPMLGYAGYSMAPADLGWVMRADGRKMLAEIADDLRDRNPGLDVHTRLFQGDAVVALRRASESARLTVVGSRGRGRVAGTLLGSVALAITARGSAPVAVIPVEGQGWRSTGPVVVGVDGSPTSAAALEFAFEEAAVRGARLVAVHACGDVGPTLSDPSATTCTQPEETAVLSEQLAAWRDTYPDVEVESLVTQGRPTRCLLGQASTAQLLVVGSRGRGGLAGILLGSTSHSLITHALCPVVIVRRG